MKKLFLILAASIILVANFTIVYQTDNVNVGLKILQQNALADGEYQWFPDKDDIWDPILHCYYQCVADGNGCAYWYDYPYAC